MTECQHLDGRYCSMDYLFERTAPRQIAPCTMPPWVKLYCAEQDCPWRKIPKIKVPMAGNVVARTNGRVK